MTGAAYRIGLSSLRPHLLHKAFERCLRDCKFWPTVAEIREAYRTESENMPQPAYILDQPEAELTLEEKEFLNAQMDAVAAKLKIFPRPLREMSEGEVKRERQRQKDALAKSKSK